MVQPLITRNIPAEFLTANHYIFGQTLVSNTGMLGLLCDPTSSFVELNDSSMARIVKPDKNGSSDYVARRDELDSDPP